MVLIGLIFCVKLCESFYLSDPTVRLVFQRLICQIFFFAWLLLHYDCECCLECFGKSDVLVMGNNAKKNNSEAKAGSYSLENSRLVTLIKPSNQLGNAVGTKISSYAFWF